MNTLQHFLCHSFLVLTEDFFFLIVCQTYSFQIITTSCLTAVFPLSFGSQLKHICCPHTKAILFCHFSSLFFASKRKSFIAETQICSYGLCLTSVQRLTTNPNSLMPAAFLPYLAKLHSLPFLQPWVCSKLGISCQSCCLHIVSKEISVGKVWVFLKSFLLMTFQVVNAAHLYPFSICSNVLRVRVVLCPVSKRMH